MFHGLQINRVLFPSMQNQGQTITNLEMRTNNKKIKIKNSQGQNNNSFIFLQNVLIAKINLNLLEIQWGFVKRTSWIFEWLKSG